MPRSGNVVVESSPSKNKTANKKIAKKGNRRTKKCILRVLEVNNTVQSTVFSFISGDSNNKYTIEYDKKNEKFSCNCGDSFKLATKRTNCKHIVSIEPMKDFFPSLENSDDGNKGSALHIDELTEFLKKIL